MAQFDRLVFINIADLCKIHVQNDCCKKILITVTKKKSKDAAFSSLSLSYHLNFFRIVLFVSIK